MTAIKRSIPSDDCITKLLAGSACRKLRQIALLALPSRVWSSTFARHTNSSEHLHCSIENATLVELGAEFNRRGPHHSRAHERFDHWPYWLDSARSIRDLHIDCADSLSADSLGLVRFPKARLDRLSLSFERCIDVSSIAALRRIFASAGIVVFESILLEPKLYDVNTNDDCVRPLNADLGDSVTNFGYASAATAFLQTSTLSIDMRWPLWNRNEFVARVDRVWTMLTPPWPTRLHLMAGGAFACVLYPHGCPQVSALRYLCIDTADTNYPALAEFSVDGLERFCSLEHLKLVWRFCPSHVNVAPSVQQIDLKLTFRLPFQKAYTAVSTWEVQGVKEIELDLPWMPEQDPNDFSQRDAWQKAICLDKHFAGELEDLLAAKGIHVEPPNLTEMWDEKCGKDLSPALLYVIALEDIVDEALEDDSLSEWDPHPHSDSDWDHEHD